MAASIAVAFFAAPNRDFITKAFIQVSLTN